ncbi:MAG: DNA topoisomerase [Promethearchaeota archaeon]
MTTILISEKNKAALAIAESLGKVQKIKKGKYIYVYYVINRDIYVIPLRGHLKEYKNTPKYKNWQDPKPRDIITDTKAIKKYLIRGMGSYVKILEEYAKISDNCVIATDADIEGCNIGIIDALPYVQSVKSNIKVSQLWISTLQPNEIRNKYNNLIIPKFSWAESAEARSIIDAFIGFSATREITISLKQALQKFGVKWTSIGRVQTSTLYLLYLREKEINDFVPETYFIIDATLLAKNSYLKAHHEKNPFSKNDKLVAKNIYEKIKEEKIAYIVNFNQNLIKRKPPTPLNTSKALILLTKILKISAKQAMDAMNALYLDKIISYPRTDSDVYNIDFDHLNILKKYSTHMTYGSYTRELLANERICPTKGQKDVGDHPPITPIESVELDNNRFKSRIKAKVYDILSRHYLALFGEEATESKQDLNLLIKDEPFKAKVVSLVNLGFLEIAPFLKPRYEAEIQIEGDSLPIQNINLVEKQTTPPSLYTDPALLKLMEKNRLGTKATRPQIIQIMQKRKVIAKIKNRYAITELGIFLIESLKEVWLPFLQPSFTKSVEEKLKTVQKDKIGSKKMISQVRTEFLALFDHFLSKKDNLLASIKTIKPSRLSAKMNGTKKIHLTAGKCPYCNNFPMKFINLNKKRFLVCSDNSCNSYLSLPKNGRLVILNTLCCICGFDVFKVFIRKNTKMLTYYLCPNCWKEGLKNQSGKGFCSKCLNYTIIKEKCVKK